VGMDDELISNINFNRAHKKSVRLIYLTPHLFPEKSFEF